MTRRLEKLEARLQRLAEFIRTGPLRTSEDLASLVGVNVQTVRRDLRALKKRGLIAEGYRQTSRRQLEARRRGLEMRPAILKGIASGVSFRGIARSLGVGWVKVNEQVEVMQRERSPELTEAVASRDQVQRERRQTLMKPRRERPPKPPTEHKQRADAEARLQQLVRLIEEEPMQSTTGLASRIGVTRGTVTKGIAELKRRGELARGYEAPTEAQVQILRQRAKRRVRVLEGVARDMTMKAIAEELSTSFSVISRDIMFMREAKDPELVKAEEARDRLREEKSEAKGLTSTRCAAAEADAYFMETRGLTLEQANMVNMAGHFKPELLRILSGEARARDLNPIDKKAIRGAGLLESIRPRGGLRVSWDGMAALFLSGVRHPRPLK